ncbi:hypothetical protein WA026_003493 [Henosepilachna vigintioctopunctata]|uniref:Uncharacterized protein n=1 Tax=Henosepilachna vigintioctopunctata TaxID=420089 RepID=A0AAW1TPT0_9CUCU
METIIRDGTLRLQTTDASCDVIINCKGNRLMAHKLILSIASPILRELLRQRSSEPSVLIFPDVEENTMSLVLDYIYTGSVVLYSNNIREFLSTAQLLGLELDEEYLDKLKYNTVENERYTEYKTDKKMQIQNTEQRTELFCNRNQRKLPHLLPITKSSQKKKRQKGLCDYITPNPWKPRISFVLEDPKKDYPTRSEHQIFMPENDSNNNFRCSVDNLNTSTSLSAIEKCIPLNFNLKEFSYETNCLQLKMYDSNTETNSIKTCAFIEESSYNSSDSNKSCNSVANLDESSNISKISEQEEDISVSDETETKRITRCYKRTNDKLSRTDTIEKQKSFTCEDCGKSFSQLRNYKYHRSIHEGTNEFAAKCLECGKVFNDRGYLSSHMKIHRDEKEYACPDCPKRFNQRVAYNMHLRIHTGIKPHKCQTCGKSFSRKMLLKQHQRVHTGERPYVCPECGKTFADRSNMSLHARLHTGVKPYACNLCSKSFTKKHHLKTHMNFHTGLKPYSCQKCGLSFSQSSNMRTHYKKCILKESSTFCLGDRNTESTLESGKTNS